MDRGSGIVMSCGIGHPRGLDPTLLWHEPALIHSLAWELPCAASAALKKQKVKKKKKLHGMEMHLKRFKLFLSSLLLFFI